MKFLKMFLAALLAVIVGGFLSTLIWIIIFMGAFAGSMEGTVTVKPHSILMIDLGESITDTPETDPLAQLDVMSMNIEKKISLYKVLCGIDAARTDDRIDGIYIRITGGGTVSASTLEEMREAIEEFKAQSGKFVVAYNESYGQADYYLATAADKIYIQPEGGMMWQGIAANVMFYKGLMDKLDISVEIFRPTACKYKSAVEPYFLTEMSEANRAQMTAMADSMWETMVTAVSESRGISVEQLNALADNLAVTLPEEALANGMVDGILYEDQMNDIFAELGATANKKGEYEFITLGEYASHIMPVGNFKSDKIAIIYAEGDIVDGYGSTGHIFGNSLAETIKSVRQDKGVKSVVVRVNSPGGSALASDIVWREMELLKAEKPVIVSMGAYAASGGYYISAPADLIVADKLTLTGSIGVFGMMPYGGKFLKNKLGITVDGVKTNKSADAGSLFNPVTATERAAIMRGVDRVYTSFTGKVSEGRNLPIEKVLEIAGGRVWTGTEGVEIGLVDGIGGLQTAIAIAAEKAGILDDYRVEEVVNEPTGLGQIFSMLNARISERALRSQFGTAYNDYVKAQEVIGRTGVQAYCPYVINIE